MRLLVFQHIAVEHPGVLGDFLAADGLAWDAVELDLGEPIPPLDGYDALWVMGGPQDVWQEDAHPWLAAEKAAIREWVARDRPFLGVCLGHQLLADALGGRVGPMPGPEVGVLTVELTDAARTDPLLRGFGTFETCLQWHGAAVLEPPPGTVVLARSPVCAVQAMRIGRRAYGLQYHVEATAATVPEWAAVPDYARSLETTLGPGALDRLDGAVAERLPAFRAAARRLYENFMTLAAD